jgi:hypothetical protein
MQVKSISEEMGIAFLGSGFDPKWRYEDVPRMPKSRYAIMREYMPTRGTLGLDMMFRSCTIQVSRVPVHLWVSGVPVHLWVSRVPMRIACAFLCELMFISTTVLANFKPTPPHHTPPHSGQSRLPV